MPRACRRMIVDVDRVSQLNYIFTLYIYINAFTLLKILKIIMFYISNSNKIITL